MPCRKTFLSKKRLADDNESGFSAYAPILEKLRRIRKSYNRQLRKNKKIDYAGMLRRGRSVLTRSSLPYKYVFVGECQDMNRPQMKFLLEVAKHMPNMMIFGDPRQAIFGFIGAQFYDMKDELSGITSMSLTRSFRLSTQTARLANAILTCAEPITGNLNGAVPTLTNCKTATEQEDQIVALVNKMKAAGASAESISILGRTKAQLRSIEQALLTSGQATRAMYEDRQPEHRHRMLDLFKLLNKTHRKLHGHCKPTKRRCAQIEQALAELAMKSVSDSVLKACRRQLIYGSAAPSFSGRYAATKKVYLKLIKATGEDIKNIRIELGRWEAVSSRYQSVSALRRFMRELDQQSPVILSTIHGAKGSEWDYVIIPNVTDGSIPFYRELKRNEIKEERRLFYVAVTRARKRVHLFHAPYCHAPSWQTFEKVSQFITAKVKRALEK